MSDFSDTLGQIGNVIGWIGGQGLNLLNMVATIEHGGLPNYLANRAQLAQDPGSRALLEQSPFYAGMAGYGMPGQVPNPADIRSGYSNTGDIIRGIQGNPSLPPMLPPAGTMSPDQAQQYAQNIHVGQPGGPTMATVNTPFGAERFGGTSQYAPPAEPVLMHKNGMVFMQGKNGWQRVDKDMPAAPEWTQGGTQPAATPPEATPEPAPAPAQADTPPAPAPTATAQPATPQTPKAPKYPWPDTPASELLKQPDTQAKVGFPSPAFAEGGPPVVANRQSIAQFEAKTPTMAQRGMTPPAPPQATTSTTLPPVITRTYNNKTGATVTRESPAKPPAQKAVPAIVQRGMIVGSEAADSAAQALEMLKKGPTQPLQVPGGEWVNQGVNALAGHQFSGPVAGRLRDELRKFRDTPATAETAQFNRLLAGASAFVFSLTGQRPNAQSLAMFDPFLPKITQEPSELAVHLQGIQELASRIVTQSEAMSNMTPEQRQGFVYGILSDIHQKAGAPATPNPASETWDLR